MKFTTNREDLKNLLSQLILTTDQEGTKPSLTHIKVNCKKGRILFSSTDTEAEMTVGESAEGCEEGTCTLPARQALDLVKNLDKEKPIKVEVVGHNRVVIKQGRSRASFCSIDPKDIPDPRFFDSEDYMPMNPQDLLEAIDKVLHATYNHDDKTRGSLEGILVEPSGEDGFIRVIGCDGHRLATCKVPGVLKNPFVLSRKAHKILKKILPLTKELGVMTDGTTIYFCLDSGIFNSRKLAKPYPKYQAVFPQGNYSDVILCKEVIIKTVTRCLLFADKNSKIKLEFQRDHLIISAISQKGDVEEIVGYEDGTKLIEPITIFINGDFVLQTAGKLPEDDLSIRIYGEIKPLVFTSKKQLSIILPIKG